MIGAELDEFRPATCGLVCLLALAMTQEKFAERIGISQNYLSTMERGKGGDWGGDPA
jgi:hypothetical protein